MKRTSAGNGLSSKQLARTVIDGKRVTFRVGPEAEVVGYLCGMDDFHWMVVTPDTQVHLVHKGQASIITLADESTYEGEPQHEALEKIVAPFRAFVQGSFFGRAQPAAKRAAS